MAKLSHFKDKTRILLLEGINDSAITTLAEHGYSNVELLSSALDENELIAQIRGVHILGIRSRTQITGRVLTAGEQLIVIGCFCIGTNQIDLGAARRLGIPVFNAPFSNSRSVAELVVGEIVMLMCRIFPKSQGLIGASGSSPRIEVCGKTLGIVGYRNIGAQLGVIAENDFGMRVIYHDIIKKLPIGIRGARVGWDWAFRKRCGLFARS
jgi:D-3-phosphoglycerate dehydrogenase